MTNSKHSNNTVLHSLQLTRTIIINQILRYVTKELLAVVRHPVLWYLGSLKKSEVHS